MTEDTWGRWIRTHIPKMIEAGWMLIENYVPPEPVA